MKDKEVIEIIEQLMEMDCLVINSPNHLTFTFIYRNYTITLNENNIWIGGDRYSYPSYIEGQTFFRKIRVYASRQVNMIQLKNLINQDYRKMKLLKINEL